jgi:hypothetical protein
MRDWFLVLTPIALIDWFVVSLLYPGTHPAQFKSFLDWTSGTIVVAVLGH